MRQISLRGQVKEMAAASVGPLIGIGMLRRIMASDPDPYFFELTLAHEGESRGSIAGIGAVVKQWAKRVVRAVAHAFNPAGRAPALIYDGLIHWHGNEQNRVAVGEIVHSRLVEFNGIDQVQAIGLIYRDQADVRTAINQGLRDCCSIEADVLFHEEGGRIVVDDVERASGVILGHTSTQLPGFAGALVRKLSEFGPAEPGGAPANQPGQGSGGADPVPPPPPAGTATAPAVVAPPAGGTLSKAELVSAMIAAGITAADLAPAQPATPVPAVPAPPAQPSSPSADQVDPFDLSTPKNNPFLPE